MALAVTVTAKAQGVGYILCVGPPTKVARVHTEAVGAIAVEGVIVGSRWLWRAFQSQGDPVGSDLSIADPEATVSARSFVALPKPTIVRPAHFDQ